jgi:hypothetical protein
MDSSAGQRMIRMKPNDELRSAAAGERVSSNRVIRLSQLARLPSGDSSLPEGFASIRVIRGPHPFDFICGIRWPRFGR